MTQFHFRSIFSLLLFALSLGPAWSAVMLTGSDADLNDFVSLLNASSDNVSFSRTALVLEHSPIDDRVCESDRTRCLNFFGSELVFQVDRPEVVNLSIGRSIPGVLIGAFEGGGVQLIDLQDLLALPSLDPVLPLSSSALLHEVIEVAVDVELQALGFPSGYGVSHDTAIFYENEDLLSRGSRGQRLAGLPTAHPVLGGLEIKVPWSESGTRRDLVIRVNGATDIADIRPGFVDTGVPYNGSGRNVQIASVQVVEVPEPESVWLLVAGLGALLMRPRKRQVAMTQ